MKLDKFTKQQLLANDEIIEQLKKLGPNCPVCGDPMVVSRIVNCLTDEYPICGHKLRELPFLYYCNRWPHHPRNRQYLLSVGRTHDRNHNSGFQVQGENGPHHYAIFVTWRDLATVLNNGKLPVHWTADITRLRKSAHKLHLGKGVSRIEPAEPKSTSWFDNFRKLKEKAAAAAKEKAEHEKEWAAAQAEMAAGRLPGRISRPNKRMK
jgi:ssDNA-binding Zn-finger/Zn-ribbon topoisomerase 1